VRPELDILLQKTQNGAETARRDQIATMLDTYLEVMGYE
jgi:hypothetical protein